MLYEANENGFLTRHSLVSEKDVSTELVSLGRDKNLTLFLTDKSGKLVCLDSKKVHAKVMGKHFSNPAKY